MDQEEIKIKYENELKELTAKFTALQKKSENDKRKSSTQLEMKENIIQKLFNQLKEIENESENKIKEKKEKKKSHKNQMNLKNYIPKRNNKKNFWKKNVKI